MVRAKFKVESVTTFPGQAAVKIRMQAICDKSTEENRGFSKYTPSGTLEFYVDNPPAAEELRKSNEFYVDFTPAE